LLHSFDFGGKKFQKKENSLRKKSFFESPLRLLFPPKPPAIEGSGLEVASLLALARLPRFAPSHLPFRFFSPRELVKKNLPLRRQVFEWGQAPKPPFGGEPPNTPPGDYF